MLKMYKEIIDDYSDDYNNCKLTSKEYILLEKLGRISLSFPFNCGKCVKYIPKELLINKIKDYIYNNFNKKVNDKYLKIVEKLKK